MHSDTLPAQCFFFLAHMDEDKVTTFYACSSQLTRGWCAEEERGGQQGRERNRMEVRNVRLMWESTVRHINGGGRH